MLQCCCHETHDRYMREEPLWKKRLWYALVKEKKTVPVMEFCLGMGSFTGSAANIRPIALKREKKKRSDGIQPKIAENPLKNVRWEV